MPKLIGTNILLSDSGQIIPATSQWENKTLVLPPVHKSVPSFVRPKIGGSAVNLYLEHRCIVPFSGMVNPDKLYSSWYNSVFIVPKGFDNNYYTQFDRTQANYQIPTFEELTAQKSKVLSPFTVGDNFPILTEYTATIPQQSWKPVYPLEYEMDSPTAFKYFGNTFFYNRRQYYGSKIYSESGRGYLDDFTYCDNFIVCEHFSMDFAGENLGGGNLVYTGHFSVLGETHSGYGVACSMFYPPISDKPSEMYGTINSTVYRSNIGHTYANNLGSFFSNGIPGEFLSPDRGTRYFKYGEEFSNIRNYNSTIQFRWNFFNPGTDYLKALDDSTRLRNYPEFPPQLNYNIPAQWYPSLVWGAGNYPKFYISTKSVVLSDKNPTYTLSVLNAKDWPIDIKVTNMSSRVYTNDAPIPMIGYQNKKFFTIPSSFSLGPNERRDFEISFSAQSIKDEFSSDEYFSQVLFEVKDTDDSAVVEMRYLPDQKYGKLGTLHLVGYSVGSPTNKMHYVKDGILPDLYINTKYYLWYQSFSEQNSNLEIYDGEVNVSPVGWFHFNEKEKKYVEVYKEIDPNLVGEFQYAILNFGINFTFLRFIPTNFIIGDNRFVNFETGDTVSVEFNVKGNITWDGDTSWFTCSHTSIDEIPTTVVFTRVTPTPTNNFTIGKIGDSYLFSVSNTSQISSEFTPVLYNKEVIFNWVAANRETQKKLTFVLGKKPVKIIDPIVTDNPQLTNRSFFVNGKIEVITSPLKTVNRIAEPAKVIIEISNPNPYIFEFDKTELEFTSDNWMVPQEVTISLVPRADYTTAYYYDDYIRVSSKTVSTDEPGDFDFNYILKLGVSILTTNSKTGYVKGREIHTKDKFTTSINYSPEKRYKIKKARIIGCQTNTAFTPLQVYQLEGGGPWYKKKDVVDYWIQITSGAQGITLNPAIDSGNNFATPTEFIEPPDYSINGIDGRIFASGGSSPVVKSGNLGSYPTKIKIIVGKITLEYDLSSFTTSSTSGYTNGIDFSSLGNYAIEKDINLEFSADEILEVAPDGTRFLYYYGITTGGNESVYMDPSQTFNQGLSLYRPFMLQVEIDETVPNYWDLNPNISTYYQYDGSSLVYLGTFPTNHPAKSYWWDTNPTPDVLPYTLDGEYFQRVSGYDWGDHKYELPHYLHTFIPKNLYE